MRKHLSQVFYNVRHIESSFQHRAMFSIQGLIKKPSSKHEGASNKSHVFTQFFVKPQFWQFW